MVKQVVAVRPFRGPKGRRVLPGESVCMHPSACAAAVSRGDAVWAERIAGPSETKVVAPAEVKSSPGLEIRSELETMSKAALWKLLKSRDPENHGGLTWRDTNADEIRAALESLEG
jgi:hypothetical protein